MATEINKKNGTCSALSSYKPLEINTQKGCGEGLPGPLIPTNLRGKQLNGPGSALSLNMY